MKRILCMFLLCANMMPSFSIDFSFITGYNVSIAQIADGNSNIEMIPLKDGYPTFFYTKFMDSENIFIADQKSDLSTSFLIYNINDNSKTLLFSLQASASEPRVLNIYYHKNNIFTIQYKQEAGIYMLAKRDFNSGEAIFTKKLTIFEKYMGYRIQKIEVSEDEKSLFLDLGYALGTYDEKYFTAIISLNDGSEVFYEEGRYLSFSNEPNKVFFSKKNLLFSVTLDSEITVQEINELNIFVTDNQEIIYLKQQENFYVVGVERKKISYIAKFFFDYGYNSVAQYYLYSNSNGVFLQEEKLHETKTNGPHISDSFLRF